MIPGINDTIAAISTPIGTGGIAIVRMSGYDSFKIAALHFRPTGFNGSFEEIPDRFAAYGHIYRKTADDLLDEAILIKMSGPKSYTTEDIVEFQCHGGQAVLLSLLEALTDSGARPAEPGEFTKRAFLNGRIDLAQAEAVMDIINARTDEAAKNALLQMDGYYSERINKISLPLIELLAHIEAVLDYPEHDIEEEVKSETKKIIERAIESAEIFINSFNEGRLLREGASVVLAGQPNVGKSSLMNRLAGKYRAIVTEIPGTTRDILEEYINLKGIPVRLVDTAGLRVTSDKIENIGIDMAAKEIKNADVVIYLIDVSDVSDVSDFGKSDAYENIYEIPGDRLIIAINKADIYDIDYPEKLSDDVFKKGLPEGASVNIISALTGQGVTELIDELVYALKRVNLCGDRGGEIKENILMTNIRHRDLMQKAVVALRRGAAAIDFGFTLDCIASDLRDAIHSIGLITGESISDAVENEIFTKFCIGK